MINLFTLESDVDVSSLIVIWDPPKNPNGVIRNYTVIIRNTVIDEIFINVSTRYQNRTFTGLSKLIINFTILCSLNYLIV